MGRRGVISRKAVDVPFGTQVESSTLVLNRGLRGTYTNHVLGVVADDHAAKAPRYSRNVRNESRKPRSHETTCDTQVTTARCISCNPAAPTRRLVQGTAQAGIQPIQRQEIIVVRSSRRLERRLALYVRRTVLSPDGPCPTAKNCMELGFHVIPRLCNASVTRPASAALLRCSFSRNIRLSA